MMKKQLIMEKALELFAEQGFEATSVQQITERCGISKGAFYLSFKSKDELILGLIDHFMIEILTDVDRIVRNVDEAELLYKYYYTMLQSFYKHSDFAKVLMKEPAHYLNEEVIMKTRSYDSRFDESLLVMVERLYGEEILHTKYDLIYCIKGFVRIYSELFLFGNLELDVDLLTRSLVEKTNLLAKHSTIPFISGELMEMFRLPVVQNEMTKEQLLDLMEQKIAEVEEPIARESLMLLKENLINPTLGAAIVKGLKENIRKDSRCKWVAYLLENYDEKR
ncbi:AcrR family transcriptional regulator [Bacillus tianshenii]|uniref:AcrR family transcriptional regulator n=1 Tax=Sutcliffiella tianshenii TaxID=1463404 RepID=A0ABS2NYI4_9BACI|nr:TetR/AcrR family transcriptional regulator [Bacillus tianshenii]MBM7619752.1 AcrR family transcriptional regulator [Bacillus tianshenii]